MALFICLGAFVFCLAVSIYSDGFRTLFKTYLAVTVIFAVISIFGGFASHMWEAPIVALFFAPFAQALWVGLRDAKFGPKPF